MVLGCIINYFDAIYTEWSRPCTIYYLPTIVACNCEQDINAGGPQPAWDNGAQNNSGPLGCPLCGGTGKISQENKEIIKFVLEFNPRHFDPVWKSQLTRIPTGAVQIKGFLTDVPKLMKAQYLRTDLQQYSEYKFTLAQEPVSVEKILQSRYFTSLWGRS